MLGIIKRNFTYYKTGCAHWLVLMLRFKQPLLSVYASVCICLCVGNFDAK